MTPKTLVMSFRTRERVVFFRKVPLSAISMPMDLSLSKTGRLWMTPATILAPMAWQ